jgi:hypothetical protein
VPRYNGPGAERGAEAGGDRVCAEGRPNTTPSRRSPIARDVATTAEFGGRPPSARLSTIALISWHPRAKGALRGFATVLLPIGIALIDCPVWVSNGKAWVCLPAKPVLDRDGKQKISSPTAARPPRGASMRAETAAEASADTALDHEAPSTSPLITVQLAYGGEGVGDRDEASAQASRLLDDPVAARPARSTRCAPRQPAAGPQP